MPGTISEEALQTIRRIRADVDELQSPLRASFVLTVREVEGLRKAFDITVEGCDRPNWTEEVKECEAALKELESIVKKSSEAASGDKDEDLKGKHNWAPLKIPPQRRLQTFVVSLFLFFTALPICTFLTVYFLLTPITFPFMLAYLIYMFVYPPRHPIKGWEAWLNGPILKMYRDYFPCRLIAHQEVRDAVDPKRNYLFCYHPHGVHSFGAIVNFASTSTGYRKLFPGITFHVQTLSINFYVPFWRHVMLWGGSGDASAKCIRDTLASGPGQSVVLVVGGAEESMLSSPKTNNLTLNKRKGFVKLALKSGTPLVPVFGFGENNVYGNYADGRPWLQNLMKQVQKKLGFALPLISGRGYFNYNFGIIPHRRPIVTVVGMPLELPKIENPTKEDIDHWHAKYIDALLKLYNENKSVYDVMPKSSAKIVS